MEPHPVPVTPKDGWLHSFSLIDSFQNAEAGITVGWDGEQGTKPGQKTTLIVVLARRPDLDTITFVAAAGESDFPVLGAPKAIDGDGKQVAAAFRTSGGKLNLDLDADDLDVAAYPVRVIA